MAGSSLASASSCSLSHSQQRIMSSLRNLPTKNEEASKVERGGYLMGTASIHSLELGCCTRKPELFWLWLGPSGLAVVGSCTTQLELPQPYNRTLACMYAMWSFSAPIWGMIALFLHDVHLRGSSSSCLWRSLCLDVCISLSSQPLLAGMLWCSLTLSKPPNHTVGTSAVLLCQRPASLA